MPSIRKEWRLTEDSFARLLSCLDPDPDRAADAYEDIRHSLITYFEFRGAIDPAKMADDTIDRVVRLLDEGREIFSKNPASFFLGVARNVHKEKLPFQQRIVPFDDFSSAEEHRARTEDFPEGEAIRESEERRSRCLEFCLASLTLEARDLILQYYRGDSASKIAGRRQMALDLGIPMNALRIRACRIREKLEQCHVKCCEGSGEK